MIQQTACTSPGSGTDILWLNLISFTRKKKSMHYTDMENSTQLHIWRKKTKQK